MTASPNDIESPEFWLDSGYRLLDRSDNGQHVVSDDFLRAYLLRPEMEPIAESCEKERALHESLLESPRQKVTHGRIAGLADPDGRENYTVWLKFRDRLVAAETLETFYLQLFQSGTVDVPPLFIDQIVHILARGVLDGVKDPMKCRAAELLFREQAITIRDGVILAADAQTVEMYSSTGGFGNLGRLVTEAQTDLRSVDLDVLDENNVTAYWERSDRFDTVINLSFSSYGLDALARVLEAWIEHFLSVKTSIQPVQEITDEKWVWHVGLDVEGMNLLNDLYQGAEIEEVRLNQLLSLFRLDFKDPGEMRPDIAGRPVYLAMAMTPNSKLRLKPQNLLVNLPLASFA